MLNRCYSAKFHERRPTYIGCTVANNWLKFSNFKAWMVNQNWRGKELDKDLKVLGNKVYGPDTCMFVLPAINQLLALSGVARGVFPLGVNISPTAGGCDRYKAQISKYGKQYHIGRFDTEHEAYMAYKSAKLAYIAEIAEIETNQEIKAALLRLCQCEESFK